MDELNFNELHKEKLGIIFDNINILATIKESDTQLPPRFFADVTNTVMLDYKAKIKILDKNTRFVTRELLKDFRILRREQKRRYARLRKLRQQETIVYVLHGARATKSPAPCQ